MALITPEYLHNPKYEAKRDRLTFQHGGAIRAGIWNYGDFAVAQRSGSPNMSVDVAAGYALVAATNPGNLGLYHVQNDATVNVAVSPSHATLPRIDQVYLLVNDSTDGGAPSDVPQILVATGNPTSGVTLDAPGASPIALPNNSLKLANLYVPANSDATGVTTANIRQSNDWARGFVDIDFNAQTADFDIVGLNGAVDNEYIIEAVGRITVPTTNNARIFVRPNGDGNAANVAGYYHNLSRDTANTVAINSGTTGSDTGLRLVDTTGGSTVHDIISTCRFNAKTLASAFGKLWHMDCMTKTGLATGTANASQQQHATMWWVPANPEVPLYKLTLSFAAFTTGATFTGRIRVTRL